ncbi:MAG: DUF2917 domain-containing protein [Burkholderiales bacterium]
MDLDLAHSGVILKRGGSLPLPSVRGVRVLVLRGRAWLTQEGDIHDYIVSGGECVNVSSSGLTVITALEDTAVSLLEPSGEPVKDARTLAGRAYPSSEEIAGHMAHAKDLRNQYMGDLFKRLGRKVARVVTGKAPVLSRKVP